MANCSKSKNKLEDDATYKSSNSSEEHDFDLEAGEKSPSTDNDTGYKEAKTATRLTNKRRKVDISCTSSEQSQAAEVVVSNEDLLIDILSLVPAKSLLKFKAVCKHWRFLISDSKFASNHACRNSSSSLISGLYFYQRPWSTKEPNSVWLHDHLSLPTLAFLDPVLEGSEYRVVDSCNGLLLFSNLDKMEYIVCNPTTQKYIAIPKHGGSTPSCYFGAYLAFDPSKSPYYKVVLTSYSWGYFERSKYCVSYIYSSKTASWKEMHVKALNGGLYRHKVFWNGAIHWMNHENVHIQLDIDAEILTETPMPKVPKIRNEDKFQYFGECGGSLLLIQSREHFAMGLRILEMKKDYCHWIMKCRFNLRGISSLFPKGDCQNYRVICCVDGANEKDFTLVLVVPGKVIAHNLNLKKVKAAAATLEATANSLANTTARLEATVTQINNRVTADNVVVLCNPQSPTNRSAVAATASAATQEAIATPVATTSATVLETTATVRHEVVTQEQPREDHAIARQVEGALTLVPSHTATSSDAALVVESSNHLQSAITEEAELVGFPTGEQPIVALPQAEGMALLPTLPHTLLRHTSSATVSCVTPSHGKTMQTT